MISKEEARQITSSLSAFHVTCVTHNSRTSQRMIDYNIKKGKSEYIVSKGEIRLIEIICNHIKIETLKILGLNYCADHLHFAIICNPEKLNYIVGKLKSMTAREFNIYRRITTPQPSTRGHAPLLQERGITQNSFWAQKFNRVLIESEWQLHNVLEYITHNRIKHGLTKLPPDLEKLITDTLTNYDNAFKN